MRPTRRSLPTTRGTTRPWSLCKAEGEAAEAFAATVPATLAGVAAALAYVTLLNERDDHPMLDDFHCYAFIASAATALRRVLDS
jgi:hypothetical protein